MIILIQTKSLIVFFLGLAGILGGFFYTAPPLKLGYRGFGEITIAFLFGVFPVSGAYYIQTYSFSTVLLLPVVMVSLMIAMVLFANGFADFAADKSVGKKTLVVMLGGTKAAAVYKLMLFIVCGLAVIYAITALSPLASAVLLLPIFIISAVCFTFADSRKLSGSGYFALGKSTVLLDTVGCLSLLAAVLIG